MMQLRGGARFSLRNAEDPPDHERRAMLPSGLILLETHDTWVQRRHVVQCVDRLTVEMAGGTRARIQTAGAVEKGRVTRSRP